MVRIKQTTKTSILDRFDFNFDTYFLPEKDPLKNSDVIETLSYRGKRGELNGFGVVVGINTSIVYTSEFLKFIKTLEPKHLEQAIKMELSSILDPRVPFILGLCQEFIEFSKQLKLQRFQLIPDDYLMNAVDTTLRMFYGDRFVKTLDKLPALDQEKTIWETKERCEKIIKAYLNGVKATSKVPLLEGVKGGPRTKVDPIKFKKTFQTIYKDLKERFKNSGRKIPRERYYEDIKQCIEEKKIIERPQNIYEILKKWELKEILKEFEVISDSELKEIQKKFKSKKLIKEEKRKLIEEKKKRFEKDLKNNTGGLIYHLTVGVSGYDPVNDSKRTTSYGLYLHPANPRNMAISLASVINEIAPSTGRQILKPSVKNLHP